jgi:hypothetical protein
MRCQAAALLHGLGLVLLDRRCAARVLKAAQLRYARPDDSTRGSVERGVATGYFTEEIDDPVLDQLAAQQALFATMGGDDEEDKRPGPEIPWKVEVPPPIAIDLRKMYSAAPESGRDLVDALSQSGPVVLIHHAITAFGLPGEKPPPIGMMGYKFVVLDVPDAATCSWAPDTASVAAAGATGHIDVGVGVGGKLGVMKTVAAAFAPAVAALLKTLSLPDLDLKASGDVDFMLGFSLALRALKVEAGPTSVGGGVLWQLYHRGEDLIGTQTLVHTVALPAEVERLKVRIETWVRRRPSLRAGFRSLQFTPAPEEHEIPIR